ncbi:MAG: PQQ-binding-like beta-propeller repeat protein [Acidobacteria bacterium]|nr:PQQ-binding-like beta-propeller repeat protein [Acidobacteriota bacterium]
MKKINSFVWLISGIIVIGLLQFVPAAQAASVTLEWNANAESDLAGYRIYYATRSLMAFTTGQAFADPIVTKQSVGVSTTAVVTGLTDATTYYFRLTARSASGMESIFNVNFSSASVEISTYIRALPSQEWPQVQYDSRRSGYVPQTLVGPYTELWRVHRRFPVSARVQPIIAQNLIFIPSNDKSIYALNASNGATAWSYATGGALVNSAAYFNGRVFFGSTDGYVYALNAANGALIWRYKTGSTVKTAPLIYNGKVYIGSSDGYMYALDAMSNSASGTPLWSFNSGAPIYDTAAGDAGRIFFGSMNSIAFALNADSGAEVWRKQTLGQGFRDRWTVAGNGKALFTPVLNGEKFGILARGTVLFHSNANPVIYNQPWSVQKTAILNYLASRPQDLPVYVYDQATGNVPFTAPILYISGGGASPHSSPVLLPNGNANVMYRRSFGEVVQWGATTNDAIYSGELNLTNGDILPVDVCNPGTGGVNGCGTYKGQYTSDESAAHVRAGDVLYLDIARGTYGLDTRNNVNLPTVGCYNNGSGQKFCEPGTAVTFNDYWAGGTGGGWRLNYNDIYSELDGDGNNIKRPTPIVDDRLYILHANTIVAVRGTKR